MINKFLFRNTQNPSFYFGRKKKHTAKATIEKRYLRLKKPIRLTGAIVGR
tara:strand:+ start:433 stop:582 length:150 start_codon:yes stop_codon:yes gene_type:complete